MGQMTIEELAQATQVSPRTIRYYITEGMLPSPGSRGRSASYGDEQIVRLQLIRTLLERHLPLAQIKALLAGLSLEEARALLREEQAGEAALRQAAQAPSPKRYVSELLKQTRAEFDVAYGTPPSSKPTQRGTPPPMPHATAAEGTWHRIALTPEMELHVRHDALSRLRPLIEQIRAAVAASDDAHDPTS